MVIVQIVPEGEEVAICRWHGAVPGKGAPFEYRRVINSDVESDGKPVTRVGVVVGHKWIHTDTKTRRDAFSSCDADTIVRCYVKFEE
jgi:hypothetical protein